ncbi:MAG: aminotransferase class V-fold PLP-dependent enzyme [Bryobacteraceae bacterium]
MVSTDPRRITVPKRLLYGPGPSMVDPRAYEAMTQPVLGIRDPYFLQVMEDVRSGLRTVFGTTNLLTFTVPGSGSGAMETAIANFVWPGTKFAIFANGHFANRIAAMAERQRAEIVRFDKPWGQVFSEAEAHEFLERERPSVVAFVQAETSTGAYQTGRNITAAAREIGALVIADCVTSLGAMPVELDGVGIDVAYSCSQKGLSCPAGLSPISISPRAWEALDKRPEMPFTWYFDLKLMEKYFDPPHVYHHTPAPPLYYAMHETLTVIEEEGLRNRWERHWRASQQLEIGLVELGFTYLVPNAIDRLWHLATVTPPPGVDEAKLRQELLAQYDIEIASGLGELAGKILRIGVMGPLATSENVDFLLGAIEACLPN